jgi:hypothetical protein
MSTVGTNPSGQHPASGTVDRAPRGPRDPPTLVRVARLSAGTPKAPIAGGIAVVSASLAIALRLPFIHDLPYTDEGGMLVVSAHWQTGGPFLYGHLFVDRPPLLLVFFRLAATLGGVVPLRVLGLVFVGAAVLCAARAGTVLGGVRGAVASSLTCAALLADPRLGTREVDAETLGVPLVLLAALLALEGVRWDRRGHWWLTCAGAAGTAAILVKQNLVDGLLFASVLVLADGLASHAAPRRTARALTRVALGAVIPGIAAITWSATSAGPGGLWYSLYGFRVASSAALFGRLSTAQDARLEQMISSALLSGLVPLLGVALVPLLRRTGRDPASTAILVMLAGEVVGVAGGGYYWTHYLIGLVPATSLMVGRAAAVVSRPFLLVAALAASVAMTGIDVATAPTHGPDSVSEIGSLSTWLDGVEHPGDSGVVLDGEAAVFETTGLRPVYPFLWTLPQRILDPHLRRLARTLSSSPGPTFVVVRSPVDPYGQDPQGRVQRALHQHYRRIADVCGDVVYLRRGVVRTSTLTPSCA